MDKNGYPEDHELEMISKWNPGDYYGLMEYIKTLWIYDDYFRQVNTTFYLSTGGWSGHEDIIAAMQNNTGWWLFHWHSSKRGGHYIFTEKTAGQPDPEPRHE